MTELYRKLGALEFPLDPTEFSDTLAPLDPARDTLLDLFKSAINYEFSTRFPDGSRPWDTVVANVDQLASTAPVQSTWPGPPGKELVQQLKTDFPALFLYREGSAEIDEFTLAEERLTQDWGLDYILAPLAADDYRRVGDILIGVAKLIRLVIRRKGHAAYQSGALVTTGTGLSTIAVQKQQAGVSRFSPTDGPAYLSLSMTLRTTELSGFVDGEDVDFQDFDLTAGTGNADGLVPGLIYAKSDEILQSPAITPPFSALY